jgi:hypothetical protein
MLGDLLSVVIAALVSPCAIMRRPTVFAAPSAIVMNAAWRAIQAAGDKWASANRG